MRNLLIAVVLGVLMSATLAFAQPVMRVQDLAQPLAQGVSTQATIGASPSTVTLSSTQLYTQVTIINTSSTDTVYIQPFGGTATTNNFPLPPGYYFTWTTTPGFNNFSAVASGSSAVIGILAH